MALPPTVRVKLSSEAAEAISLTPVVVQELAIRDLIEHVLGVAGKDEARLCEILLRGTLVSGGSRFCRCMPESGVVAPVCSTVSSASPMCVWVPGGGISSSCFSVCTGPEKLNSRTPKDLRKASSGPLWSGHRS